MHFFYPSSRPLHTAIPLSLSYLKLLLQKLYALLDIILRRETVVPRQQTAHCRTILSHSLDTDTHPSAQLPYCAPLAFSCFSTCPFCYLSFISLCQFLQSSKGHARPQKVTLTCWIPRKTGHKDSTQSENASSTSTPSPGLALARTQTLPNRPKWGCSPLGIFAQAVARPAATTASPVSHI